MQRQKNIVLMPECGKPGPHEPRATPPTGVEVLSSVVLSLWRPAIQLLQNTKIIFIASNYRTCVLLAENVKEVLDILCILLYVFTKTVQ